MTFKTKKLDRDVAQVQFEENLPLLPFNLINAEYESRCHLVDLLYCQAQSELLVSLNTLLLPGAVRVTRLPQHPPRH